ARRRRQAGRMGHRVATKGCGSPGDHRVSHSLFLTPSNAWASVCSCDTWVAGDRTALGDAKSQWPERAREYSDPRPEVANRVASIRVNPFCERVLGFEKTRAPSNYWGP